MQLRSSTLKEVAISGLVLSLFILYPLCDFISQNYFEASFSLSRCAVYFLTLFVIGSLFSFLGTKFFKLKSDRLVLIFGMAMIVLFYNYAIESKLQALLLDDYRLRYLIISDLLLIILACIVIRFKPFKIAFLLTMVCSILFNIFALVNTSYHSKGIALKSTPAFQTIASSQPKKNVYFIVPDGHIGPRGYEQAYHEPMGIVSDLEKRNFKVLHNSFSNANVTVFSLPQIYSMNYLFENNDFINGNNINQLGKLYSFDNPVIQEFRRRNYKLLRFADGIVTNCYGNEDNCVQKRLLLNQQDFIFLDRTLFPRIVMAFAHGFLKTSFKTTMEINQFIPHLPKPQDGPFLLIGHFGLPHEPFRFDQHCNRIQADNKPTNEVKMMQQYQDQVGCARKLLTEFVDNIIANDPNAIIIIQADHGPSRDPRKKFEVLNNSNFLETYNILYAFYGPDDLKKHLVDGFSPVNTFRLVFAHLDNSEPNLLAARSFYAQVEHNGYVIRQW